MELLKETATLLKSSRIIFIVIVGFAIYLGSRADIIGYFSQFIANDIIGIMSFILVFALITILVPLTALPLIIPGSVIFGSFFVSIYSIIGWTIGASVAFLIARHLGKSALSYFISIKKIEQYEMRFSNRIKFLGLVLLRMIMPVDLLSYAVGLFSKIRFTIYITATILGISPFAFIFAYAGNAIVLRQYNFLAILFIASILIVGLIYYMYKKYFEQIRKNPKN